MAEQFQFDLVSPERRLASIGASEVHIPAAAGDMTAMAGHEPTITTLRPGFLRAETTDGTKSYIVTGGFAEISGSSVTILAERAIPVAEVDDTLLGQIIEEARELAEAALPEDKDVAEKNLADVMMLQDAVRTGH